MDKRYSWTESELIILKDIYESNSREEILKYIPQHTWVGIFVKAQKLGLSRHHWIGKYKRGYYPQLSAVRKKQWKNPVFREKMLRIQKENGFGYRKMEKHPMWKGGRRRCGKNGYIRIKDPNNPNADSEGYILEHRYIMEKFLKRILEKKEQVHHKNGIRNDNRIENLEIRYALPHNGNVICPYCKKSFGVSGK